MNSSDIVTRQVQPLELHHQIQRIHVGIIGTAGRNEDESKMTREIYERMVESASHTPNQQWKLENSQLILVSGGAAWSDHIAVTLFLRELQKPKEQARPYGGLILYLPCHMKMTVTRLGELSAVAVDGSPKETQLPSVNTTASIMNAMHKQFSSVIGWNSMRDFALAQSAGAVLDISSDGFQARNKLVAAKAERLLCFTWGTDPARPKEGSGSEQTWNLCQATIKLHLPLGSLMASAASSSSSTAPNLLAATPSPAASSSSSSSSLLVESSFAKLSASARPALGPERLAELPAGTEYARVFVRCRPLSARERQDGGECCVELDPKRNEVLMMNPNDPQDAARSFILDGTFDGKATQQEVYDTSYRPLVESVLEGTDGACMHYGQTGSGKTFTCEMRDQSPPPVATFLNGTIYRAFEQVFEYVREHQTQDVKFMVRFSQLELYNNEAYDCLSPEPGLFRSELKEHPDFGVYVQGQQEPLAANVADLIAILHAATRKRKVRQTSMSSLSSRTAVIHTIKIERWTTLPGGGGRQVQFSKLNIVDMAGSERQARTYATGERLQEAAQISLSLSSIGNVVRALTETKITHVPYRDSKLTRLLQESLGGHGRLVWFSHIGPATMNRDETLSTLRMTNRVKSIKCRPRPSRVRSEAQYNAFENQRSIIPPRAASTPGSSSSSSVLHHAAPIDLLSPAELAGSAGPPPPMTEKGPDFAAGPDPECTFSADGAEF